MNLRTKVIWSLALVLSVTICSVWVIGNGSIVKSFEDLERSHANRSMQQVQGSLRHMVATVHGLSVDWSDWNDAYQFMIDKNPDFIASNLSVLNLKLNLVTFFDTKGSVFYGKSVGSSRDPQNPTSNDLRLALEAIDPHWQELIGSPGRSGLLKVKNKLMMLSARPIRRTDLSGPSRGTLVFGKLVDAQSHIDLWEMTRIHARVSPVGDGGTVDSTSLDSGSEGFAIQTDAGSIKCTDVIEDIFGHPVALLTTSEPRLIMAQGRASADFAIRSLAAIAILAGALFYFVIEFGVVRRLRDTTLQLQQIGRDGSNQRRVNFSGRDELGMLAQSTNELLDRIDEQHQQILVKNDTIHRQAFHDGLTDLPNRNLLLERLERALDPCSRGRLGTALLYIDLDDFKVINDSLGHAAGDELLVTVSGVLQSCVRPWDTVARLGGDEFTVLLTHLQGQDEADRITERILSELRKPLSIGSITAHVSASVGLAFIEGDVVSPEELLRRADIAMYQAKKFGKANSTHYDDSMDEEARIRLDLQGGLLNAVENGELRVVFQPIYNIRNGKLKGVESLLRWDRPGHGTVSPDVFIPIAEETGAIAQIGEWVLEQSCRQVKVWNDKFDANLTVSVNLSGRQLQRTHLEKTVQDVLDRTHFPADHLTLEITETILMQDKDTISDRLNRVKSMGVKVAIDDFGTGYSAMSSLSEFPLDIVKIDKAFVRQLGHRVQSEAIIEAIVTLSKSMGFAVTAEGIETEDQLGLVKRLGCDLAQGYFFSPPVTAEQIEAILDISTTPNDSLRAAS